MAYLLMIAVFLISSFGFAQAAPGAQQPMGEIELIALVATGSTSEHLAILIKNRGVSFTPDESFLKSLQQDGADSSLLTVLQSAKIINSNPPATEVLDHLNRAAQLNRNNFHPLEAEPEFQAAVQADPSNPFAHCALGSILLSLNQPDAAEAEFRAALQLQPDLAEAHSGLADVLLNDRKRHREALAELKKAADLEPYDPEAQYEYARALLTIKGGKEEAENRFELAKKLGGTGLPKRLRKHLKGFTVKRLYGPPPRYPALARARRIEGTVHLEILIAEDGIVKDIRIISGDPSLTQAATDAVAQWRNQPALVDGIPMEVITPVSVNFVLR